MSLTLDVNRDQELDFLRTNVRQFLDREYPIAKVREARDAKTRYLPDTWAAIAELGFPGIAINAADGGADGDLFEAAVVIEELGRALCETPFVASAVVAASLLADPAGPRAWLPAIAAGSAIVTFSESGGRADWTGVVLEAGAATGSRPFVPYGDVADVIVVAGHESGASVLFVVRRDAPGVATRLLTTIDAQPTAVVDLTGAPVAESDVLARGSAAEALAARALALGATAAALAAAAGAERAVEITAEYVKSRVQFGRPVATFQAVKHRLANMYTEMSLAKALAQGAVRALARDGAWEAPVAAAKSGRGDTFNSVARGMVQMHGGVGYTWEFDAHLFMRRAAGLAAAYGTSAEWLERIAAAMPVKAARRAERHSIYDSGIVLSPEDIAFRDEWSAWLDANLPEEAKKTSAFRGTGEDRSQTVMREWRRKLADGRWAAIAWPPEHGGRGATALQQLIFREELYAREVSEEMARATVADNLAGAAIMQYGTKAQQEHFLPRIQQGEILFCQGFSEPDAGSDLAGLKTRAVLDGDTFVVNGQKIWTSGAHLADWIFVLVRTDPDAPKHRGISMLLADMKSPGLNARPIRQITNGAHFNEVFFEDVRVPRENLVGELNRGWVVARSTLQTERSGLGGTQVLDNTLNSVVRTALKTRLASGKTAWEDDGYRRTMARAAVTVESLRQFGYAILMKQVKDEPINAEPSIAKLVNSELRQAMTELSMDILGPAGTLMTGSPNAVNNGIPAYAYLAERGATIGGGTSEVNRNAIAEKGLGLPKD